MTFRNSTISRSGIGFNVTTTKKYYSSSAQAKRQKLTVINFR